VDRGPQAETIPAGRNGCSFRRGFSTGLVSRTGECDRLRQTRGVVGDGEECGSCAGYLRIEVQVEIEIAVILIQSTWNCNAQLIAFTFLKRAPAIWSGSNGKSRRRGKSNAG
jgi:hypothetical protein